MKKFSILSMKYALIVVLFSTFHFGHCQKVDAKDNAKRPFKERISIGGALGFGFGSNSILVDVSPIIGYSLTDNLVIGLGLTYKYYQLNDYYYNLDNGSLADSKNNIYGGSIFTRYFLTGIDIPVIENMFLHGEVEPLIFTNDYKLMPYNQGDFIDAYGNYFVKENEQVTITSYFAFGLADSMLTQTMQTAFLALAMALLFAHIRQRERLVALAPTHLSAAAP